jgi:hypothetical protein
LGDRGGSDGVTGEEETGDGVENSFGFEKIISRLPTLESNSTQIDGARLKPSPIEFAASSPVPCHLKPHLITT